MKTSLRVLLSAVLVILFALVDFPTQAAALEVLPRRVAEKGCTDDLARIAVPAMTLGEWMQGDGYRKASLQLDSPVRTGVPNDDRVQADFYLPSSPGKHPAAVVLHGLYAMADARFERGLAASLARAGYVTVFMDLPFHRRRTPKGYANGALFIRADLHQTARNVQQAAADASALVRWLGERSDVDSRKIGLVGVSIGGFIVHLVMGRNSRIRSAVTFVAGGDVAGLLWKSHAGVAVALRRRLEQQRIDEKETARQLTEVEPLTYADCNTPRSVLMVNGTDDLIVPRSSADAVSRALHHPPQLWLPTDHFGLVLFPDRLYRLTRDFLGAEMNGKPFPRSRLKEYAIPVLKTGAYFGLQSRFTLGAGLEYPLLYASHRPFLRVEGSWTGRGIFVGFSVPLHPFLDLGIAWRIGGGSPTASLFSAFTVAF